MKKKKYLGIVAAALLAVAPVASVPFVAQGQSTIVKAASTATSDQLMAAYYAEGEKKANDGNSIFVELTKKTPYITVKAGTTVKQVKKQRITDINTNYGTLAGIENFEVYDAFDNGSPDLNSQLSDNTKLQAGRNYVVGLRVTVDGLPDDNPLAVGGHLDKEESYAEIGCWVGHKVQALLFIPIRVTEASTTPIATTTSAKTTATKKSSTTKISKHGYVVTKKNKRVRTYTSTGKFSKHYAYRHHTYKLNRKKYIKGHGTCYKIYGKDQWIPSKYLKLRK